MLPVVDPDTGEASDVWLSGRDARRRARENEDRHRATPRAVRTARLRPRAAREQRARRDRGPVQPLVRPATAATTAERVTRRVVVAAMLAVVLAGVPTGAAATPALTGTVVARRAAVRRQLRVHRGARASRGDAGRGALALGSRGAVHECGSQSGDALELGGNDARERRPDPRLPDRRLRAAARGAERHARLPPEPASRESRSSPTGSRCVCDLASRRRRSRPTAPTFASREPCPRRRREPIRLRLPSSSRSSQAPSLSRPSPRWSRRRRRAGAAPAHVDPLARAIRLLRESRSRSSDDRRRAAALASRVVPAGELARDAERIAWERRPPAPSDALGARRSRRSWRGRMSRLGRADRPR